MQHFGDITAEKLSDEKIIRYNEKNIDLFGSGDTKVIYNFLSKHEADNAFDKLFNGEIKYQQWHHMPNKKKELLPLSRLKIAMADIDDKGWIPHYRFPVNNQDHHGVYPFSDTIKEIRDKLIKETGIQFNHSVVLLYRDGNDCIGFHKDKTLDLSETEPIASITLGQDRIYMLRDNIHNPTKSQEIMLTHGTLLMLGMKTNSEWYHSVPMIKQPLKPRISITFRVVTTFKNINTGEIKGQGDKYSGINWPIELGGVHINYPNEILDFWFGKNRDIYNGRLWWNRIGFESNRMIDDVDKYIRDKWGNLLDNYKNNTDLFKDNHYLKSWMNSSDGIMALILLFDQFPRHIYRGSAKSFYFDNYAFILAKHLLENYPNIPISYKMFSNVALMHSEDINTVSNVVLELLKIANSEELSKEWKTGLIKTSKSCQQHVDVLKRFGRYPHRNKLLGRENTLEETDFLSSKNKPKWMKSVSNEELKTDKIVDKDLNYNEVKTKLKILVLHSNRQTAQSFRNKTDKYLEKKIKHIADLTYCNAPKIYEPSGEIKQIIQQKEYSHIYNPENSNRVWWNASDDPKTMVYNGLEDSLKFIDSFFKNEQYDGIIGFSQGGALAGIIASLVHDYKKGKEVPIQLENISKSLRFIVIISGFYCRDTREGFYNRILENIPIAHLPENINVRKDLIDIPSFHVWGREDTLVNPWRSQKLSEAFRNKITHIHPSSHFTKAIKYWPVNEILQWLEQFIINKTTDSSIKLDNFDNAEQLYDVLTKTYNYNDKQIYDVLLKLCYENQITWETLIKLDTNKTTANFRKILTKMIGDELKTEYEKYYINKITGIPSKLAKYAPRYNLLYKTSRLYCDVATYLATLINIFDEKEQYISEKHDKRRIMLSYNQYGKIISRLMTLQTLPIEKPHIKKHIPRSSLEHMMKTPLSEFILYPRAEPVDVSQPELLEPLYKYLKSTESKGYKTFEKGTVCDDGRLDLCKQVIGPIGIYNLIESLRIDSLSKHPKVQHLLLGNNICGNELGVAIAKFIKSGKSALTTWYIAGNNLDEKGIEPICEALQDDKQVKQLWLKRNPIHTIGISHIIKMLNYNTYLKVLDLTNTAIMDDGAIILLNNMNSTLEYLYLSSNGLTWKTCEVIKDILHKTKLKQIALGCNRFGDNGAKYIAEALINSECKLQSLEIASCGIGVTGAKYISEALKNNKSLVCLNFGFLKSTNDLGEVPNQIESQGASYLADMLAVNKTLRSLDITYTSVQQGGIDALAKVLSTTNTSLIHINLEQFGIPYNELSRELIRESINRNKNNIDNDELIVINNIIDPKHLEEIRSVYRIQ